MSHKIWFTSDTHAWHRNIAGKAVSKWDKGYRDFKDENEMTQHIIRQFNKYVAHNDILYHLGDWSFGGINNIWNFRVALNCQCIHLILGNHDHHIEQNRVLPNHPMNSLDQLEEIPIATTAWDIFESVGHAKLVEHGQHAFWLAHYSHRVWIGSHKSYIHLFGHSHDSLPMFGKSMDVGIDTAKRILGEYRPFSVEEVIQIMSKREIEFPDKHNESSKVR